MGGVILFSLDDMADDMALPWVGLSVRNCGRVEQFCSSLALRQRMLRTYRVLLVFLDFAPSLFTTLLTALNSHLTWFQPDQKPRKLTLAQALKITLIYHRHTLSEELVAEFFSIFEPTVSRTITLVEKALLDILEPLIKPREQALDVPGSLVVDGTLAPAWKWRWLDKINFSGQHQRAGFNHQVI